MKIIPNCGREYYADGASPTNLGGAVSKSMLWSFHESPLKWKHGGAFQQTPAMVFGSVVHELVLQRNDENPGFLVSPYDEFRTNEAKEWKANAEAQKLPIIKRSDLSRAEECAAAILDDEALYSLGGIDREVAIYHAIGSTQVKGMIDIVPHHDECLVDLKTTSSIGSVQNLQRTIISRGYHWQAALYLDLYNAAHNANREEFRFMFVEVEAPFEIAWVSLAPELIEAGRAGYMNAIAKYQQCVAHDRWPGAVQGIARIEMPAWANNNQ